MAGSGAIGFIFIRPGNAAALDWCASSQAQGARGDGLPPDIITRWLICVCVAGQGAIEGELEGAATES